MKIALHLNDPDYVNDYLEMGVDLLIAGSTMSSYCSRKLTIDELKALKDKCSYAQLFVMVNGLYEQHELADLKTHIDDLHDLHIDGIVFQDFGVLQYVLTKGYSFRMLYDPLTLNTNHMTLNVLKNHGVDMAMVAREIPLQEQCHINAHTTMPLMIQCHGVSYMGSSKRHLLAHYGEAIKQDLSSPTYTIVPDGSEYNCLIYEDERGTTIFSQARLYMLDLFTYLKDFDYLYIETMMMSPSEALEVTSMYADCLKAYREGRYHQYVKEYLPLLKKVSQPLERGFIDDKTIYHLDDVKRRDAGENV